MKTFKEFVNEALTKKTHAILDLIQQQVKLDLNPYVVDSFSNQKLVTIETDELSQRDLANIERIAHQFKTFRIEPNGRNKIALILVTDKNPYKHVSVSGI